MIFSCCHNPPYGSIAPSGLAEPGYRPTFLARYPPALMPAPAPSSLPAYEPAPTVGPSPTPKPELAPNPVLVDPVPALPPGPTVGPSPAPGGPAPTTEPGLVAYSDAKLQRLLRISMDTK